MQDFLDAIFGNAVSADRRISLFTLPERRSHLCATSTAAASLAEEISQSQDVYFGVGLIRGKPKGRGKAKDVCAIGALWADVDFASEAHPNKSLPADEEDFEKLLAQLPLAPSIIVESGHGRHLYWLLQEPWLLGDKAERQQAARVAHGWHEVVCSAAEQFGWSLENLGELARVLRLPGTVNRKLPEDPRPVRILEADYDRRFAIANFEQYLPEIDDEPISTPVVVEGPQVEPALQPPTDKLQAALQESSQFWQTWHRCRSDLLDQSASAYDLSLATLAVLRGWSDSEIAALIIAWRRLHDERPEKAARPDYLSRTIARARASESNDEAPVDLSNFNCSCSQELDDEPAAPEYPDPGPIPEGLLRIPGFVSEVMDYCIENAPTRNPAMAFCGALALQSFLAGRKVRDPADNRTNLYILALAPSGSGKDYPRKINKIVLSHIGLGRASVLRFASGEAIEDKLAETPCLLCQTDEIDGLLLQIKNSRDGRYESLMDRLKEIYTSADQSIMTRCLAKTPSTEVHQPSLTLLGSATPSHYYSALSEKMLTDGFFSRTICIEATADVEDQDPNIVELQERILETADWWARYSPAPGNIAGHNPSPRIVPMSDAALKLIREVRIMAREEQNAANESNRAIDAAVWSRVRQMTHKLALIHAISKNHTKPRIDVDSVSWATEFSIHQARRMLFMAQGYVSSDEFDMICKKALRVLADWRSKHGDDAIMPPWRFRQRMNQHPQKFKDMVFELEHRQQIRFVTVPGKTKPFTGYQLI